tara:strand:- start:846 stop:1064 length:219 start_codon:yes stop_codon:yes gene_type:complete
MKVGDLVKVPGVSLQTYALFNNLGFVCSEENEVGIVGVWIMGARHFLFKSDIELISSIDKRYNGNKSLWQKK